MSAKKIYVLAADVLSEIQSKALEEVARVYAKEGSLTQQQQETLGNVYFGAIGKETLAKYRDEGVRIRGVTGIKAMIDMAHFNLDMRAGEIDSQAEFDVPQISDSNIADRLTEELGTGMSVHNPQGWTEEDFRYGLPPQGGRYLSVKVGMSSERAEALARKDYSTADKTVDEVIATIPRKYKIENQTYVLDVKKTLEEADLHASSAGFHLIEQALTTESRDPEAQDNLRKLFAECEFKTQRPEEGLDEDDEELDDE